MYKIAAVKSIVLPYFFNSQKYTRPSTFIKYERERDVASLLIWFKML